MTDSTDIEEFFVKIEHEGGIPGALDYGLRTDTEYRDLPKEMVDDWSEVRDAWEEFETLASEFRSKWEPASVHAVHGG